MLNYNGRAYLKTSLDTLLRQTGVDFEVLFIDNGSSDDSVSFVRTAYSAAIAKGRLRLHASKENTGFAQGNNIGYQLARGDIVVFLNNDVNVPAGWLAALVHPLREFKDIHVVGTAYYDAGHKREWQQAYFARQVVGTCNLVGESIAVAQEPVHAAHLVRTFFVSGNGLAMRRGQHPQPFDGAYFAYAEDTYLGWRAQLRGETVVLNLHAQMAHLGGGTKKANAPSFSAFALFHGHKNQLMNWLLFYESGNLLRTLPILLMTQLGHVLENPRKIPVKARAYAWVLWHFREILRKRRSIQKERLRSDMEIIAHMSGLYFDEETARRNYRGTVLRALLAMNRLQLLYCRLVRLPVRELRRTGNGTT
jgi:GT2 family glycosyltransferase